jgi:hypothetical protein
MWLLLDGLKGGSIQDLLVITEGSEGTPDNNGYSYKNSKLTAPEELYVQFI